MSAVAAGSGVDALGMVWSAFDTAFTDNLTAVAGYAAEHGHACPPADAVWGGQPVGTIMKNARTAQRRTEALERRAEAGETGGGVRRDRPGMVPHLAVSFFQTSTASSSRSIARRAGCCQDQPCRFSSRHVPSTV
ncbi:helicase associated domain-containing protein [Kitasatospora sp. NBC_00085]